MSDNIFMREGIGGSAGMLVHEATKNFEKGKRFDMASDGVPPAGRWIKSVFPAAFDAEPIRYGEVAAPVASSCIDTLFRRRSVRVYADRPLSLEALGQFLAMAYPEEVIRPGYVPVMQPHQRLTAWNSHVTQCRLVLLARRVQGVAPGAYLVDERERVLRPINDADLQSIDALLKVGCFQEEFRAAPAFLMQLGSIHDALIRYGERGYRYMLLENGVLLQRMYLAAATLGLASCVTGSIIQKEFERWLGIDGYQAAAVNGFALGHLPAVPAPSPTVN
jgi:SagB-type dehydrogenase family enzyme